MSSSATPPPSSGPRTYAQALALLSRLPTNRSITHDLFSSRDASPATLNAAAIPEMLSWLRRAGLTPAVLAGTELPGRSHADGAAGGASAQPRRYIHVAGTKGKGSVTALTASVLARYPATAGRVGAYLSPHVVSVRERILLDGAPIPRDLFARYFFEVWDALAAAGTAAAEMPFYFRFLTLVALHAFAREGVRSAVVECGIGGEYDATNVLPAGSVAAAVVTQLGVDHAAMLGGTVEEIAWHKAGVLRRGVKGFTRRLPRAEDEGVMRVLRARAEEKGAELVEVPDRWVESWQGIDGAALQGPWQRHNMALAVAAAREHLLVVGHRFEGEFARDNYALESMPGEFREGLRTASLRGRCETFARDGVEWFVDGAHTVDSLAGVGQWFGSHVRWKDPNVVKILVFNQQDREAGPLLRAMLESLEREAKGQNSEARALDYVFFTRNDQSPASADEPPRDLAVQQASVAFMRQYNPGVDARASDNVEAVINSVRTIASQAASEQKFCHVLVTGSFHLAGSVLRTLDPEGGT